MTCLDCDVLEKKYAKINRGGGRDLKEHPCDILVVFVGVGNEQLLEIVFQDTLTVLQWLAMSSRRGNFIWQVMFSLTLQRAICEGFWRNVLGKRVGQTCYLFLPQG